MDQLALWTQDDFEIAYTDPQQGHTCRVERTNDTFSIRMSRLQIDDAFGVELTLQEAKTLNTGLRLVLRRFR